MPKFTIFRKWFIRFCDRIISIVVCLIFIRN